MICGKLSNKKENIKFLEDKILDDEDEIFSFRYKVLTKLAQNHQIKQCFTSKGLNNQRILLRTA